MSSSKGLFEFSTPFFSNNKPPAPDLIHRHEFPYAQCYCVLNVWWMLKRIEAKYPEELDYCHVVLIHNAERRVLMWKQSLSALKGGLILWEYHVIMVYSDGAYQSWVYDCESQLPFPTEFKEYCKKTFKLNKKYFFELANNKLFRVVCAELFLRHYSPETGQMQLNNPYGLKGQPDSGDEDDIEFKMKNEESVRFSSLLSLNSFIQRFYFKKPLSINDRKTSEPSCGFTCIIM